MIKDINSLGASYNLRYIINDDYENVYHGYMEKYDWDNKKIAEESEFINGYKLVKLANGFYGYIRESDNKLMEHLFNIATDFNEYGYAMVGRNDSVTWINKDFYYLSDDGWVEDQVYYDSNNDWFNGYLDGMYSVDKFSNSDVPISRTGRNSEACFYIGTDGKTIKFKALNEEDTVRHSTIVKYGTPFNEYGYATSKGLGFSNDNYFLFQEGYYMGFDDFVKYSLDSGLIDSIHKDVSKKYIKSLPR